MLDLEERLIVDLCESAGQAEKRAQRAGVLWGVPMAVAEVRMVEPPGVRPGGPRGVVSDDWLESTERAAREHVLELRRTLALLGAIPALAREVRALRRERGRGEHVG